MHDAFLKAITATPDDMLPRLIYADWLEERGDPRGEFIRLHIKLYELAQTAAPDRRQLQALQNRARGLWQAHHADWEAPVLAEFPAFLHEVRQTDRYGPVLYWSYERGFPERFVGQGLFFLKYADLFALHFPLREVVLIEMGQNLQQLARCPLAGRPRKLTVHATSELHLVTVQELIESPYLQSLDEFILYLIDYSRPMERILNRLPGCRVRRTSDAPFVRRWPDLIEYG